MAFPGADLWFYTLVAAILLFWLLHYIMMAPQQPSKTAFHGWPSVPFTKSVSQTLVRLETISTLPRLVVARNLLSKDECEELIHYALPRIEKGEL